ncbi:MAG: chorismate mutase [Pseudohongiellaceae bacterium]
MSEEAIPQELQAIRQRIDEVDEEFLILLAKRFKLTHQVGLLKASKSLDPLDAEREAQKLAEIKTWCKVNGLNPELVVELFTRIMEEAVSNHRQISTESTGQIND